MKRIALVRWLVVVLAVAIPSSARVPAASETRLRAVVTAGYGQTAAEVRVQAIVQPARENRELDIVVDSGGHYRRSRIDLDGAEAPRVHVVLYRSMPPGRYEVKVALLGESGGVIATSFGRVVIFD